MQWYAWGGVPCGGMSLLLGADGVGAWVVGTCQAMDDGLWHHDAGVVRRDASLEFYVDGQKLSSPCYGLSGGAAWAGGQPVNISHLAAIDLDCPCSLCLGASCQRSGACNSISEPWIGSLDEVAYWSRALTPTDIANRYNQNVRMRVCQP
jgi:hypothetical protein